MPVPSSYPWRPRSSHGSRAQAGAGLGIVLAIAVCPGAARAEIGTPPPPPTASATASAPAPAARVDGSPPLSGDANADRVVLLPTAYTHPAGTVFVSDYDIALVQVGYAFTNQTQLTLTGVPPLGPERIAFLDLTLKSALFREDRVRVAALGSVSGAAGNDLGLLLIGRVGGVVQLCLRADCASSLNISSNVTLLGPVLLMVNGVGAIWAASARLALLAEAVTLLPVGKAGGEFNGAALAGGLRIRSSSARWALDLTLVRAIAARSPIIPLLAFTYRSG